MSRITFNEMPKAERAALVGAIRVMRKFLGAVEIALLSDRVDLNGAIEVASPASRPVATIARIGQTTTHRSAHGVVAKALEALRSGELDDYSTVTKLTSAKSTFHARKRSDPDLELQILPLGNGDARVTYRLKRDEVANA